MALQTHFYKQYHNWFQSLLPPPPTHFPYLHYIPSQCKCMCASSKHICVCGSVCVCVCGGGGGGGGAVVCRRTLQYCIYNIYISFEVSHTHGWSYKAQCACPCQWDTALQTRPLIKSITEAKALSTSLSMREKPLAPAYQWGKSP